MLGEVGGGDQGAGLAGVVAGGHAPLGAVAQTSLHMDPEQQGHLWELLCKSDNVFPASWSSQEEQSPCCQLHSQQALLQEASNASFICLHLPIPIHHSQ